MAKTLLALFDSHENAEEAVRDLTSSGFDPIDIGLAVRQWNEPERNNADDQHVGSQMGTGLGALLGGMAGMVLGVTALVLPGIGPIIVAGPLAALLGGAAGTAVGAVAGGVTGGLVGSLVDIGVPQQQAEYYAKSVRRGGTLLSLTIQDENRTSEAEILLRRHNPFNIEERVSQWKEKGWRGFDALADPYTAPDKVEADHLGSVETVHQYEQRKS